MELVLVEVPELLVDALGKDSDTLGDCKSQNSWARFSALDSSDVQLPDMQLNRDCVKLELSREIVSLRRLGVSPE